MQIATFILTMVILFFCGKGAVWLVNNGHHLIILAIFVAMFAWGRWVSTDWEREQDDKNFAAWKQKWRFRFSRIWPARGEILPPNEQLPPPDQGVARKFPKSS